MLNDKLTNIFNLYPQKIAIEEEARQISYSGLSINKNLVAGTINSFGLSDDEIIGIYIGSKIEYIISMLGVMFAGKIFMPIDVDISIKNLSAVLEKTKPAVLITDSKLIEKLLFELGEIKPNPVKFIVAFSENYQIKIFKSDNGKFSLQNKSTFTENKITKEPDKGCYILTTSGSTGVSKAILGSYKGLSHFIDWELSEFNLDTAVRASLLSPVTFDVSLRDILVPLTAGGTLCIPDEKTKKNPAELLKWFQKNRISLTHIVPTLLRLLLKTIQQQGKAKCDIFDDLKYALIAGEVLYGSDVESWRSITNNRTTLVNIYGPSETTLAKLFYRIKNEHYEAQEIIPLGFPLPGTEVLIFNDNNLCGVNEVGELHIKTAHRSHGYFDDPALNEKSFIKNPLSENSNDIIYKTGDLGKYLPDGSIQFIGRKDTQVKLHGKRVEMTDIEVVLNKHNEIIQSAVTIKKDQLNNDRLVAYLKTNKPGNPGVETLRSYLLDNLPEYMIPSIFIFLPDLPKTVSGKISRIALPEPDWKRPILSQTFIPPANTLEKTISKIWADVLQIDRVGTHDNFFDLGGNSVLTAQVITALKSESDIDLPVVKFFQHPTIKDLIAYLNNNSEQTNQDEIRNRARLKRESLKNQRQMRMRNR